METENSSARKRWGQIGFETCIVLSQLKCHNNAISKKDTVSASYETHARKGIIPQLEVFIQAALCEKISR